MYVRPTVESCRCHTLVAAPGYTKIGYRIVYWSLLILELQLVGLHREMNFKVVRPTENECVYRSARLEGPCPVFSITCH